MQEWVASIGLDPAKFGRRTLSLGFTLSQPAQPIASFCEWTMWLMIDGLISKVDEGSGVDRAPP